MLESTVTSAFGCLFQQRDGAVKIAARFPIAPLPHLNRGKIQQDAREFIAVSDAGTVENSQGFLDISAVPAKAFPSIR